MMVFTPTFATKMKLKLKYIYLLEYIELQQLNPDKERLAALKSIAHLLEQLDHDSEVLPDDLHRVERLLISLKGEALNDTEYKIVRECCI
jgi:hypothetical protein